MSARDPTPLSVQRRELLRTTSGISGAVIEVRGYRTIIEHKELSALGFVSRQLQVPGLLLPGVTLGEAREAAEVGCLLALSAPLPSIPAENSGDSARSMRTTPR